MGLVMLESWERRKPSAPPVIVGADIGQKVDPTAIAVCEVLRRPRANGEAEFFFETRHLERLPLGTAYPQVAERIAGVVDRIQLLPRDPSLQTPRVYLVVDATGVGQPVVDILRAAVIQPRVSVTAATFTHGDRVDGTLGAHTIRVGKAHLVSRLQALMQTNRVRIPATHPEAEALRRELLDYEIRITEDANDRYGAFRTGTHDDIVTALGLATLFDPFLGARVKSFA